MKIMSLFKNIIIPSSLLFIVSATSAWLYSKLFIYQLSNTILIGSSYLCNLYKNNKYLLIFDYMTILGICISYINNFNITIMTCISFIYLLLYNCINIIDKLIRKTFNKEIYIKQIIKYEINNILEEALFNTIDTIKNIIFIIALLKSNYNTFMYMKIYYFIILFTSSISGIIIYIYRFNICKLSKVNNSENYLLLTWLWHICITIILHISSINCYL